MKSKHKEQSSLNPMGLVFSLFFTAVFGGALGVSQIYLLPLLQQRFDAPSPILWYSSIALAVSLPMLLVAIFIARAEKHHTTYHQLKHRLRIRKLTNEDWIWIFLSIMLSAILTMVLIFVAKNSIAHFAPQPDRLLINSIEPEKTWVLLAWVPLFLFNLISEELFWRGYLFPRQQEKFKKHTWLFNGLLWLLFRLPMGLTFLLISAPTALLTTFAFQKTQNLKVAIIINGTISGIGFLAIALGYL